MKMLKNYLIGLNMFERVLPILLEKFVELFLILEDRERDTFNI